VSETRETNDQSDLLILFAISEIKGSGAPSFALFAKGAMNQGPILSMPGSHPR
jgi:hypothetical protein